MSLVGSLKAINKLKEKGLIAENEYNELKDYIDK